MSTSQKAGTAVLIISFVLMLAGMTSPLLAYIMKSYPEIDPGTAMRVLTLPALIALIISFAVGPIATKINKKLLLIFSSGCVLIYFAVFAVVGSNGPFSMLLVAAGIVGICQGSGLTLISSIIGEFIEGAKRATVIALSMAMMNGGGAIISLLGGVIAAGNDGANWPYAYYLGILVIPAMILFWIIMPWKPDAAAVVHGDMAAAAKSGGIPIRAMLMILLAAVFFICIASFMLNVSIYVISEYELGTSVESGLANSLFTILGIVAGFSFALFAKVFRKWIVFTGFAITTLGLLMMVLINTSLVGIYVGAALMGLGFGLANPYLMAQIIGVTPPRLVPIALSLMAGGVNLCMFFTMDILGFLSRFTGGGLKGILTASTIIAAICTVLSIFLFVFTRVTQPAAPTEGKL